ncbi:hypothetical protein PHLCEN_2v285 [Hermanssonia centrifuga]|uniref:Uncharacterized protein n=1 Tax=Hermanssonia centrifuga TaxID=98765 RepID=A0A2R6S698_9APHY|nr:hypothetical protein PHLCEN_2v285 [Hermanssonia centrifuga]
MSLLRAKTILRRSSFSFIPVAPSRHTFTVTTNAQAAISHNSIDGLPSGFISGSRTIASSAPLAKSGGGAIPAITPTEPDRRYESPDPRTPTVYCFFEKATSTWQYIVADEQTSEAVIIDPVLDYDPASGGISTKTADGLVAFVTHHGLRISHILQVTLLNLTSKLN